jgi:hypothetical protein
MQRGFAISQDQAAMKAAYSFQVHANLTDIQLLDCSARVSESFESETTELRLQLAVESTVLRIVDQKAMVSVSVKVEGQREAGDTESTEPPLFQTACRYSLTYELADGFSPSDEEQKAFAAGNAVFHAWPYSREFLQSLASKMGISLAPLPLLRLVPLLQAPTGEAAEQPAQERRTAEKSRRQPKSRRRSLP